MQLPSLPIDIKERSKEMYEEPKKKVIGHELYVYLMLRRVRVTIAAVEKE